MRIRKLRLEVHLGVSEEERSRPQTVAATVTYRTTVASVGSDVLTDTVDYRVVRRALLEAVSQPINLLETLAASLAQAVLRCDPRIESVHLTVAKSQALRGADAVECRLSLQRTNG